MRILSITAQRPDSTGSGVYLTELVHGFRRLGCEQAVLAGVGVTDESPFPEDVAFYPVRYETEALPYPILGMSDQMPYRSTRYSDMTDDMTAQFREAFGAQILAAADSFRPDVILCHHLNFLTALVRELCPDSCVFAISHGSDLRQLQKNPWQRDYIRAGISRLDGVFALHEEQKKSILKQFALSEERVSIIGTGYNSSVFHLSEDPAPRTDPDRIRLIFAGKIAEKKGVFCLLHALHELKSPERYLLSLAGGYGDRDEYEAICREAEQSPVEIRFLGKLPQHELAEEMTRSDIFVLPSFYEGLPLVLIEAMACGLRAVCTDLPGIRPWLDAQVPGNGVVFVTPPAMVNQDEPRPESLPKFEQALAEAILSAQSAPLADRIALRAISWDGLCRRILELWKSRAS